MQLLLINVWKIAGFTRELYPVSPRRLLCSGIELETASNAAHAVLPGGTLSNIPASKLSHLMVTAEKTVLNSPSGLPGFTLVILQPVINIAAALQLLFDTTASTLSSMVHLTRVSVMSKKPTNKEAKEKMMDIIRDLAPSTTLSLNNPKYRHNAIR